MSWEKLEMQNAKYLIWNLKDIINELSIKHPEIMEIYLFGSRAYKTESVRSDIDILAFTCSPIAPVKVNEWLHEKYPPVDLFTSYDRIYAISVVNGSKVSFRNDGRNANLQQQLDAILLWTREFGFSNSYLDWNIETANNITFQMSIIPSYPMTNFDETLKNAMSNLEASGIKTYFAGSTWQEITYSITNMIENAMKKPKSFEKKVKSYSFDTIKLQNEYDFQNMILSILRPIYLDISPENFMIRIDGADKMADFGIANNQIVIEAKWIDTNSKKAEVLKTLAGLKNFYSENSNVKCLLFLILYKSDIVIDTTLLEYKFSFEKSNPQIIVRFIKNEYE